jgi:hypothetical protein
MIVLIGGGEWMAGPLAQEALKGCTECKSHYDVARPVCEN